MRPKALIGWVPVLLMIGYPLLVFWGLRRLTPRIVALLAAVVIVIFWIKRAGSASATGASRHVPSIIGLVLCGTAAVMNAESALLFMPAIVSCGFLVLFGWTLVRPPSMVERIAVKMAGPLPENERPYCRTITWVWTGFFLLNISLAIYTALGTSRALWVWYNGIISYVLIGLIFAAELVYRYWKFRRYVGLPTDFIFKKIFPPRPELRNGHGRT